MESLDFPYENGAPKPQSTSESDSIIAWDGASCHPCKHAGDAELVRKKKQLLLIEEEIARKKASIALKKRELQPDHSLDDGKKAVFLAGSKDTQSPDEEPGSSHHTPETSNSGPPPRGFDRFLSILNQGIDLGRLSEIVTAPQHGAVDNKGAEFFHDEAYKSVDWDHDDWSGKEKGYRCKRTETSDNSRDRKREYRDNHGTSEDKHKGSSGRRSDLKDKHRKSNEEKIKAGRREKDRGRNSKDGDGDWDSRERERSWNSRGDRRKSRDVDDDWDLKDRDRSRNSRGDRRNSRDGDMEWDSRERDWSWNSRRGYRRNSRDVDRDWYSRERDRSSRKEDGSLNYGGEERTWNFSKEDRDSRHRRLESRHSPWGEENRDGTSKAECQGKEWRDGDRRENHLEHYQDSQSPNRRSSKDISSSTGARSRSSSPMSLSSEDKRSTEEKEQVSMIQSLFQTVGLNLGLDELDRLNSRTQERLYGVRQPVDGAQIECRKQRQCLDSSQSSSLDDRSLNSQCRQNDSQEHRGDAECLERDSETQSIDLSAPRNSAVQNLPLSTPYQPLTENYSNYATNSSQGQHHSASAYSFTTGWGGVAHSPYDPQYLTQSTLSMPLQAPLHVYHQQLPAPPTYWSAPPIHQPLQQTLMPPPLPDIHSLSNLTHPLLTDTLTSSFPLPTPPLDSQTHKASPFLKELQKESLPPLPKQNKSVLLTLTGTDRRRNKTLQKKRAKERLKTIAKEGFNTFADVQKFIHWQIHKKNRRFAQRAKKARKDLAPPVSATRTAASHVVAITAAKTRKAKVAEALAPPVSATGTAESPVVAATVPAAKPVIVLRLKSGEVLGPTRPAANTGNTAGSDANMT